MDAVKISILLVFLLFPVVVTSQTVLPVPSPWIFINGNDTISYPETGGLNSPRFQFADLNQDGVDDLFILDNQTEQLLFLSDSSGRLKFKPGHKPLPIINWFLFADLDGNSSPELVTQNETGECVWYRFFTLERPGEAVLLPGENGDPIVTDPLSQPHLADADLDGDLDFFGGLPEGSILHWENTGTPSVPLFSFRTLQYGGILVLQDTVIVRSDRLGKPTDAQHGASAVYLFDYEKDGLTDVFFGDFLSSGIYRFRNTGTPANPVFSYLKGPFPDWDPVETPGYNQVQFAGPDSLPELFVGVNISTASRDNFLHYRNYGTRSDPEFFLETRNYLDSPDWGRHSKLTLADLNGDGLSDLITGSQSDPVFFLAAKPGNRFDLSAGPLVTASGLFETAPAIADLNGDGLSDLVSGTLNQGLISWENTGTSKQPLFVQQRSWLQGLGTGNVSHPSFTDWDQDGDPDLVVGNANGDVLFFENTGTPTQPVFTRRTDWTISIPNGPATPLFTYLNEDKRPDLIVGSSTGSLWVFEGQSGEKLFDGTTLPKERSTGIRRVAPGGLIRQEGKPPLLLVGTERGGLMFLPIQPATPVDNKHMAWIFPNPGSDQFTIQSVSPMTGIRIYNLLGQETDRYSPSGTSFSFRFDHRSTGLYFARIRMGTTFISCRFLVIR